MARRLIHENSLEPHIIFKEVFVSQNFNNKRVFRRHKDNKITFIYSVDIKLSLDLVIRVMAISKTDHTININKIKIPLLFFVICWSCLQTNCRGT